MKAKAEVKKSVRVEKIKAGPPKKFKPPFGVLIGRRTVDGEYLLDRQEYDSSEAVAKFATSVLKNETYDQGLREVIVYIRQVEKNHD